MLKRDNLEVQVEESQGEPAGKKNSKGEPGGGGSVVQLHPAEAHQTNQQAWVEHEFSCNQTGQLGTLAYTKGWKHIAMKVVRVGVGWLEVVCNLRTGK